jgi:hypothetical protein
VTDIAVMLPGEHWTHVSTVDVIHMDIRDWDTLKPQLTAHPRFRLGQAHFEPHVWQSMRDDGDFLTAGVWDGEYSELVRMLAPFFDEEISSRLLPGLARTDNAVSVGTVLIMALVDLARDAKGPLVRAALQEAILMRADQEYAMPRDDTRVIQAAQQLATAVLTIPFPRWRLIAGPVLANKDTASGIAVAGPLPLFLDECALVLRSF